MTSYKALRASVDFLWQQLPLIIAFVCAGIAPGQTVDQDHDNDGVKNGIEYFMGESGTTFTVNPSIVSGAITWPTVRRNIPRSRDSSESLFPSHSSTWPQADLPRPAAQTR